MLGLILYPIFCYILLLVLILDEGRRVDGRTVNEVRLG
jgi:hypothetical protein